MNWLLAKRCERKTVQTQGYKAAFSARAGAACSAAIQNRAKTLAGKLAMAGNDVVATGAKQLRQFLYDIHRAMLATCAANVDSQISSIVSFESRYPLFKVRLNGIDHLVNQRLALEKLAHLQVTPGQPAQGRLPKRVG